MSDGKVICKMDDRREAEGFYKGQAVVHKLMGHVGTVIGFGPAFHDGCTVFILWSHQIGKSHTPFQCGSGWIRPMEEEE